MFYTDDPVRDANEYAAWCDERREPQTVTCEDCGVEIGEGGRYLDMPAEFVLCEDCVSDHMKETAEDVVCDGCLDTIPKGERCLQYKGKCFCASCVEKHWTKMVFDY